MSGEERPEPRKLTDARTLRALAHPVRIGLYEELAYGGAMTATEPRHGPSRVLAAGTLRCEATNGVDDRSDYGREPMFGCSGSSRSCQARSHCRVIAG